jgi:hypothetical protein
MPHMAKTCLGFRMLDQEPLIYPSRHNFVYKPGMPDRQLWALGMVMVQWGMTEFLVDLQIHKFMGDNPNLNSKFKRLRNFKQTTEFFQELVDLRLNGVKRQHATSLITRIKNLSSQRDEIVHRMWGGGMQGTGPGDPDTDAQLSIKVGEKPSGKHPALRTIRWRLDFAGLRKIALAMAELNRDMLITFVPPAKPTLPDVG